MPLHDRHETLDLAAEWIAFWQASGDWQEEAMDARNVLVVEDDAALSKLVGGLLTGAGYHPVAISDHTQIAAAVARWDPRCVILDGEVTSTGRSRSWEDAAAIRRAHPSLPVVMFTADGAAVAEAEAGTSVRSRAAHFAGTVSKPFVIEQFLATVKTAVETPDLPITVFPNVSDLPATWPQNDLLELIVHELRAPLTVIRGQAQLARRFIGRDPERERDAIDSAIVQADRMAHMITELLDHSRLASNGLSLKVVGFDLVSAVRDAVTRHDFETPPRIKLRQPPTSIGVNGDPERIAQILDNLLSNALKYSEAGEPIDVSVERASGKVLVRVADRGVGVPEEERNMLFTPFYRTSRTRAVPGTGLGLHISRRLAERHGGQLSLESSSRSGSVFTLALPVST